MTGSSAGGSAVGVGVPVSVAGAVDGGAWSKLGQYSAEQALSANAGIAMSGRRAIRFARPTARRPLPTWDWRSEGGFGGARSPR